jgi:hypothetical protein
LTTSASVFAPSYDAGAKTLVEVLKKRVQPVETFFWTTSANVFAPSDGALQNAKAPAEVVQKTAHTVEPIFWTSFRTISGPLWGPC